MDHHNEGQDHDETGADPMKDLEASGVIDSKQKSDAEQSGRTGQVTGEDQSFKREVGGGQHGNIEEAKIMQQGGTLDPEEDKPQSSTYPA